MIDLHSHILPGVDDGAPDVAASLRLAEEAASRGTRVIAATPHLRDDHPGVRPAELADRAGALDDHLAAGGVPLQVVSGAEVDLDRAERASDDELALASYGERGRDLLVETPYGPLEAGFEDRVLGLARRGFRVLLAHPERSRALRDRPERLEGLVRRGVLVQVTARAVSDQDTGRRRFVCDLLREQRAHVLASDAHHAAGPAPPDLDEGVAAAELLIGSRARWMATDAPAAILAGEPLPAAPA